MRGFLLAAALALVPALSCAFNISAPCPSSISVVCPDAVVEGSSPTWTGSHLFRGLSWTAQTADGSGNMSVAASTLTLSGPTSTSGTVGPILAFRAFRGALSAMTAVLSGDILGVIPFMGHDGTQLTEQGATRIMAFAGENWSPTTQGAGLRFDTTANGGTTRSTRMVINPGGGVGLGFAQNTNLPQQLNVLNGSLLGRSTYTAAGNVQAPAGYTVSTTSATFTGNLGIVGVVTSTAGFVGPGAGIFGTAVSASSFTVGALSLATSTDIQVVSATATLRGGPNRRVMLLFNGNISNDVGAPRTYTFTAQANGVGVGHQHNNSVSASDVETLTYFDFLSTTTFNAGVSTFTVFGRSSNATGTQTLANGASLAIVEF